MFLKRVVADERERNTETPGRSRSGSKSAPAVVSTPASQPSRHAVAAA